MSTILIVDDSILSRSMLARTLKQMGHTVIAVAGGQEALDLLSTEKPDVITTDLLMDGMDGIAFIEALKEAGYTIPIIVITADIQDAVRLDCEAMGARFTTKPFSEESLTTILNEVLP